MPYDPRQVKLGRRPVRRDPRNLMFAKYLDLSALPIPPRSVDFGEHVKNWGMLANDKLGDCTVAGILHMIMLWRSNFGPVPQFTDAQAIGLYSQLCGYVPGDAETDQGGVELDILNAWRKSPIEGCDLLGFVSVDPANWLHVKIAHWLAGTLYMGIELPVSAQTETIWADTSDAPGGWGGHAMVTSAYRDRGGLQCASHLEGITWGAKQKMTPHWLAKYCVELYAPITTAWFDAAGKAPNGFKMDEFEADLRAVQAA